MHISHNHVLSFLLNYIYILREAAQTSTSQRLITLHICEVFLPCDRQIYPSPAIKGGPGNSVGIATDYGLDGPVSNPGGDEIFRQFRPTLGPTQPPVKWVPGLSRG